MRELFQGNDPHMIQRNAPEYVGLCNFCPIIVVSNVLGKPTTIGAWTAKRTNRMPTEALLNSPLQGTDLSLIFGL